MKFAARHAFANQILIWSLVVFGFGGAAGLGTVWLRHQISVAANHSRQMEQRLVQTERRLAELATFIAAEQSPEVLDRRNHEMRIGLVRPREAQVVRVAESATARLAAKRQSELFADEGGAVVIPASFVFGGPSAFNANPRPVSARP